MGIEFSRGFFVFDKSWIHENEFVQSLSHAEFRILIYLLSSALKITKRDSTYRRGNLIASLYQDNKILIVNTSQRTIAEKCKVNRATVFRALNKFKEVGALIKMPDHVGRGANDYYIIGFEREKVGKQEYYLVDSIPVSEGHKVPEEIKKLVLACIGYPSFDKNSAIWQRLFGITVD